MRIASSAIGMESDRSYQASKLTVRRFAVTEYQRSLTNNNYSLNADVGENDGQETEESAKSAQNTSQNKADANEWYNRMNASVTKVSIKSSVGTTQDNIRQITIKYIFDLLFSGRRTRFRDWIEENSLSNQEYEMEEPEELPVTDNEQSQRQASGTWLQTSGNIITTNFKVLSYQQETLEMEKEEASFSTKGTVKTADGREITFNVNVGMSREFQQYYSEELDFASFKMCDPLVINLDTDVAELTDQTFYFDVDADGEKDEISTLSGNSGYLALDKNNDGIINDGNELFGTKSGNGFADLAKYDEDGNGWIDEGDSIWSKLKIWCKNENGEDELYRLSDKNVGAICLQNAATDFTLKGDNGQTKGAIRSTGIFLYENGNVGTVQHVDVAKYERRA